MQCQNCNTEFEGGNFCPECGVNLKSPNVKTETLKLRVIIPGFEETMNGGDKASEFLKFGVIGLIASNGKKRELDALISVHEQGIKINLINHEQIIKINWEEILNAERPGITKSRLVMSLINGKEIIFKPSGSSKKLKELLPIITSNMCGVKQVEEGWSK